jgi:hypothetical protein
MYVWLCQSSKVSWMMSQALSASRRRQIAPCGCAASRSVSVGPNPIGVYRCAVSSGATEA